MAEEIGSLNDVGLSLTVAAVVAISVFLFTLLRGGGTAGSQPSDD